MSTQAQLMHQIKTVKNIKYKVWMMLHPTAAYPAITAAQTAFTLPLIRKRIVLLGKRGSTSFDRMEIKVKVPVVT